MRRTRLAIAHVSVALLAIGAAFVGCDSADEGRATDGARTPEDDASDEPDDDSSSDGDADDEQGDGDDDDSKVDEASSPPDAASGRRDSGVAMDARVGNGDSGNGASQGRDSGPRPEDGGAKPESDAAVAPSTDALGAMDLLVPDPSWNCGFPDGIPPPELGKPVFEATLTLGSIHELGETHYGDRTIIEVRGGNFTGSRIKGTFLERGLDWQLTLSTGAVEIEGVDILKTSGGANIYTRICGVSPSGAASARVVFDFEAPNSSDAAFLNQGKYVGSREFDAASKKLVYKVYDVTGVQAPANKVQVKEPDGVPDQSYDCKGSDAQRGSQVYMCSVSIGAGSVSVGSSKRGSRNIIPITGGSCSGRLQGTVLSGGADYQLSGGAGGLNLDARYTLKMNDGTLIMVRNCGPASALVPVYETSKKSSFAWINEGKYLSSSPQISIGAVILTTYEAR